MSKNRLAPVFAVVLILVILLGEMYAFAPSGYGYNSEASIDGDTISYSLTSDSSNTYRAVLLDNGDYKAADTIYILYDESYRSNVNEDAYVEVGAHRMTQSYFLDQVTKILRYRGISDVQMMNASDLKDKMSSEISSSTAEGKGLVIASGAIPSLIMNNDGTGVLDDWICNGGSLYWIGNVIGKYISFEDRIEESIATSYLIGTNTVYTGENRRVTAETESREAFSLESGQILYSPKLSELTDSYAAGFTDGEYSSITFIKKGSGQICICGGELGSINANELSKCISSGLCWCSKIVKMENGTFSKNVNGTIDASSITGNKSLYLCIGDYFCVYGHRYQW